MNNETVREVAAGMLSTAICDAIASSEPKEVESAKDWIFRNDDSFYSFIFCCRAIGVDFRDLRQNVKEAVSIGDFPITPQLYLVQSSEPCYNKRYEENSHSHRSSQTKES